MKCMVTTFAKGWSYNEVNGWGEWQSGGRSSHQDGLLTKRRATEQAKKLADKCGHAIAINVVYKKGVRLMEDIEFGKK